jgi:predicted nuclease of predicted toxin-antitoxin system
MRFLADENVSALVIKRLRDDGHDIESIRQLHPGVPDERVLDIANAGNRILLTEDHDFGELIVRQRLAVRGLVLLELDRLSAQAEAEKVSAIVHEYGSRFENHFVVIEPTRVRLRPLRTPP